MTTLVGRRTAPPAPVCEQPSEAVAERAHAALDTFPASEVRVVEQMLARGAGIIHASVSDIARAAGVGAGSVVRACQRLGFAGFRDAKVNLSWDLTRQDGPAGGLPAPKVETPSRIAADLALAGTTTIRNVVAGVDAMQLELAVQHLSSARSVLVLGTGGSVLPAQDVAYRLVLIGRPADAPLDIHTQHVRARLLGPGAVALAVSESGTTSEVCLAARAAGDSGAVVVALCGSAHTPLATVADVVLVAGGGQAGAHDLALTRRWAFLLILDAVVVSLALADPRRAVTARGMVAGVLAQHRL